MALLAAYNFNEASGDVLDRSGNGRGFSIPSDGARVTGKVGGGYGSTADSATGSISSTPFGQTADRTVMMWLKGAAEVWHIRWVYSGLGSGAWGLATLSGQAQVRARNGSNVFTAGATFPTDGAWHHICGTYKQSTSELKFYLDGTLAETTTVTGPLRTDNDDLGLAEWGGIPASSNNAIDDVRIYDECLDATAISTLMATPVPDSLSNDGAIANKVVTVGGTMAGTVAWRGVIANSLPVTPAGTFAASNRGVVAGTVAAVTGAFAGTVVTRGLFAGSVPALSGQLPASLGTPGVLTGVIPSPGGSLAATVGYTGVIAGTLPTPVGALTGTVKNLGALAGVIPSPFGPILGDVATRGAITGSIPIAVVGVLASANPARINNKIITVAGSLTDLVYTVQANPVELRIQRYNTKRFIAADPISLILKSRTSARTATGGMTYTDSTVRPRQTFKLIMQSPAGGSIEQRTEDGTERQVDYILLGEWNAEVSVGDWWEDQIGQRWEVRAVVPTNGYEIRAVVEAHGKVLVGG